MLKMNLERICCPNNLRPTRPVRLIPFAARRAAICTAALLLIASSALRAGTTGTLDTPTFKIHIEVRCEEGEVTCDDVKYVGTKKKTGESLELTGKTAHHMAADGTPGKFLGYIFKNEGVTYFLSEDGLLRITKGEKVLLEENGTWTWDDAGEASDHRSDTKR
jgi:hypothetical protein